MLIWTLLLLCLNTTRLECLLWIFWTAFQLGVILSSIIKTLFVPLVQHCIHLPSPMLLINTP